LRPIGAPDESKVVRRSTFSSEGVTPVALGRVAGARSGDKGGNANLGVWVASAEAYAWLVDFLTSDMLTSMLPELGDYVVVRHALPNLFALNFVVQGLLGRGVSSCTRVDPQAKSLGEELRAVIVEVPTALIGKGLT
jgi:hypothetical protein